MQTHVSAKNKREDSSKLKHKLTADLATRMWRLTCSVKVNPRLHIDLKDQAVYTAADLEKKLLEAPGDLCQQRCAQEAPGARGAEGNL